jgi:class 3 adenylate cyclase
MVENHFSNYLRCIYHHGGEINETSGDGIMVIFKSDTIEDYALEAVSAALEIIEENKRLNKEYTYPWGEINLHLGIGSGEAYVGTTRMESALGERWTYTASGLVTILASRIGALSEKSRLYIGADTHDKTHEKIDCDFLGNYKLKNVSEQAKIYHVTQLISSDSV